MTCEYRIVVGMTIPKFVALALALLPAVASRGEDGRPVVLCLGDSLTAGYGLRLDQAWPAILQARLAAEGLPHRVVNGGLSGDTSAGGLRRVDWLLQQPVDVLVLALGANDALRGLPPAETERNLQAILDRARARHPSLRILLAGMRAPPNLGAEYAAAFDAVYPRLAKRNRLPLWPFLLDGVAARAEMNLDDAIHPNADGQRHIADQAWRFLRPLLEDTAPVPSS